METENSLNPIFRRFTPYPSYKDSGVEWLGKIPTHWGTDRLKYVVTVSNERSYDPESELPFIGLEHIESGTGRLLTSTKDGNGEIGGIESSSSHFRHGDILFGKLRPYLAKVLKPDFEGRCSTELSVLRCGGNIYPQNLSYQLLSSGFISWINSMTYGTKMPRANAEQIVNTKVPLASLPEQCAIAKFLDRETAKIDALIAIKERLIELLQEKRTALITQAVTKGLDPNVPMKDSGVTWLGKIPAHWEVRPLKHRFSFNKGRNSQLLTVSYAKENPGSYPVYSGQTENEGIMGFVGSFEYEFDEVLFSTTVGAKVMTPMTIKGRFSLSQNCLIMIPKGIHTTPRFFYYQLHPCFSYERAGIPDYMQPSLRISDLMRYVMGFPPSQEQSRIAAFLDRETARIDGLITKIHEAIDHLKEYRTALISAAVTGKIDVRDDRN